MLNYELWIAIVDLFYYFLTSNISTISPLKIDSEASLEWHT